MPGVRCCARTIATLVAVVHFGVAFAQTPRSVENLSATRPDGTRVLEQRVIVPAPAQAVWDAWATTDGFRSWAAPVVGVDFRLGGSFEASYDFAARLGDPDNIRNTIVALVPGRMFAIRNVQAPAKAPFDAAAFQSLHTVVFVEPRNAGETQVTIVMPGIGSGPAYDGVYKHFEWGNAYTLEMLRRRFAEGPTDWAKVAADAKAKAK